MVDKNQKPEIKEKPTISKPKHSCLKYFLLIVVGILFALSILLSIKAYYSKPSSKTSDEAIDAAISQATESETKEEPAEDKPKATTPANTAAPKSQPQDSASVTIVDTDKQKMIDFFVETGVYSAVDKSLELYIHRWTKPTVSVGVAEGTFTESLNRCLNTYIADFNSLSSTAKLVRDDTVDLGVPNIKIYYWPNDQFMERGGASAHYSFVEWLHNDDNSIKRSMMFMSHDVMNEPEAVHCQIVRHEMTHAIGFWGHSNVYPESIMSLPKTRYLYPSEDKTLIRLLYNYNIPLGSKASAVKDFLNRNYNP